MQREELLRLASVLAGKYRLSPPRLPAGGGVGAFAGQRDGQSVDFHDFREYQPGDDLRRVDWRAYARSGQMHLKLFREEVSPVVELHLDTSASMAAYPGKEQAALFLAAFLRTVALASEGKPVLCRDGRRFSGSDFDRALLDTDFSGPSAPAVAAQPPLSARPMRFFLSDYLFGDDLPALLSMQSAGSLAFCPLMLLSKSEVNPPWRGLRRLRDVEAPERILDMPLNEKAVAAYARRLAKHCESLNALAFRNGGRLIVCEVADEGEDRDGLQRLVERLAGERLVAWC